MHFCFLKENLLNNAGEHNLRPQGFRQDVELVTRYMEVPGNEQMSTPSCEAILIFQKQKYKVILAEYPTYTQTKAENQKNYLKYRSNNSSLERIFSI